MMINAYRTGSAGRRLLLSRGAEEIEREGEFLGHARIVAVDAVSNEHGRPKLVLIGVVDTVQVDADTVRVADGTLTFLWEYQFEREQLVALTRRGLLEHGLSEHPFQDLVGNEMQLPVHIRLSMLTHKGEDHLFIARMIGRPPRMITATSSGYDLADYFAMQPEVDPLTERLQAEAERLVGFEGVDVLFDNDGGAAGLDTRAQAAPTQLGNEGRADFEAAVAELLNATGDPLEIDELPEPGDTAATLVAPAPEATGLDQAWAWVAQAQPDLDPDSPAVGAAEKRTNDAVAAEETLRVSERSRIAQGLGHIPSAYTELADAGAAAASFDELEL